MWDLGQSMPVKWLLGDVWFNDTLVDGCQWIVNTDDGWSGSPLTATDPRIISLRGWVIAPTWEARRTAEHRLNSLCLDPARPDRTWELRCVEETGPLSAWVSRDAAPLVSVRPGGNSLDFTLQLKALDPRKYGTALTKSITFPQSSGGLPWPTGLDWTPGLSWGTVLSNGSMVLSNPGRADAPVQFVITGSTVAGESLINPRISAAAIDGLLLYNDTLATTTTTPTVTFDTSPRKRTVLLNGTADRRARAAGSRWFTIPAMTDLRVSWSADSMPATAQLTAIWSPAHW
jgi:hypothetical protein